MLRSLLYQFSSAHSLRRAGSCLVLALAFAATLRAQTETVLHDFVPEPFGANPYAQLIADASGNLYGTTASGGVYNNGVVFELKHDANGRWSQKVLYTFSGLPEVNQLSRLLLDSAGNLYGIIASTDTSCGVVYRLSPSASGSWTYTNLYSFNCNSTDGESPSSGLTMDRAGNLYGVTAYGGAYDGGSYEGGIVYELTRAANGTWSEQILYNFGSQDPGGYQPQTELVFDSAGNIFGVTTLGGDNNCNTDLASKSLTTGCGAVFELTQSNGAWSESVLYTFTTPAGYGNWGYFGPITGLTMDSRSNLYGSTTYSFYELQPNSPGSWTYVSLAPPVYGPLLMDKHGNFYGDSSQGGNGNGFVFELQNASGVWTLNTIYTFPSPNVYLDPFGGLVMDANGHLFGTTYRSYIANDNGAVFELIPSAGGTWTEGTIFQFPVVDGSYPNGDLVADSEGNLYGVASAGLINQYGGVVFRLSPRAGGNWKYDILYDFAQSSTGGAMNPLGGVVFDAAGNLYGVAGGGIYGPYGDGTVYKLSPTSSGYWNETTLYSFGGFPTDGIGPVGGLVIDQAGNLYGVTSYGGSQSSCGCYGGTVFELSPEAGATWKEVILHSFQGKRDGALPRAKLVMDRFGNLYGTTFEGGSANCSYAVGCGTVFELTPGSNGAWSESIIHRFTGTDGEYPEAALAQDVAGNLYGTTSNGGAFYSGTVFKLSPNGAGNWTETPLYSFNGGINGGQPEGDLNFDAAGNLYGTTSWGGSGPCIPPSPLNCGTIFKLTPTSGEWTFSTVHRFGGSLGDGTRPQSGVYIDGSGSLFTMTTTGPGSGPGGTVVEIKP
jgi:uncharacterized repeat protein (TIGR03803 family)